MRGGGGHGSCVGAAFDGDGAPGLTPASSVTPDAADQKWALASQPLRLIYRLVTRSFLTRSVSLTGGVSYSSLLIHLPSILALSFSSYIWAQMRHITLSPLFCITRVSTSLLLSIIPPLRLLPPYLWLSRLIYSAMTTQLMSSSFCSLLTISL